MLVNLITGATLPDSGEVVVFGKPTTAHPRRRRVADACSTRFGLLSERAVLVEQLTAEQNLAMPISLEIDEPPDDAPAAGADARATRSVSTPR